MAGDRLGIKLKNLFLRQEKFIQSVICFRKSDGLFISYQVNPVQGLFKDIKIPQITVVPEESLKIPEKILFALLLFQPAYLHYRLFQGHQGNCFAIINLEALEMSCHTFSCLA